MQPTGTKTVRQTAPLRRVVGLAAGLALATSIPTKATALGGLGPQPFLKSLTRATTELSRHPFGGAAFSLTGDGRDVEAQIRAALTNPLLGITLSRSPVSFGLATGAKSLEVRFHAGGIPICRTYAVAHVLASGEAMILGTLPQVDANERVPDTAPDAWPPLELTLAQVAEGLPDDAGAPIVKQSTRCLHAHDGHLMPAWDLVVDVDGLPWVALADGYETFSLARNYFDVDGTGRVFPNNTATDAPADFPLKGLAGDGTLTNEFIATALPSAYPRATEPGNVFAYDAASDRRYDEVASFYYAQRHYEFVTSLGYVWSGPKPLTLNLHMTALGRKNNALYVAGDAARGKVPTITIHDGDGFELRNLITDADVVSHEFGHHVVYNTLKEVQAEALVLHEGLADFFTFMRSGDACLGESICPAGSGACVLENQCLRTGDGDRLDLKYDDRHWQYWQKAMGGQLGHLHGQIVSGVLWDLKKGGDVPDADLGRLVMRAVSFFKSDSGLRDLLLSLFLADRELFQGKYFTAIKKRADERNLGTFIADVADSASTPDTAGGGVPRRGSGGIGGTAGSGGGDGKEKKKTQGGNCGVVGAGSIPGSASSTAIILLPLLALAAKARRKRQE